MHPFGFSRVAKRSTFARMVNTVWPLLPVIRRLVDARRTYGFRCITALLRGGLAKDDQPRVNHKRVYCIMRQPGVLLARHSARRPGLLRDCSMTAR